MTTCFFIFCGDYRRGIRAVNICENFDAMQATEIIEDAWLAGGVRGGDFRKIDCPRKTRKARKIQRDNTLQMITQYVDAGLKRTKVNTCSADLS